MTRDDLVAAVEESIGAVSAAYEGSATESDLYEASLLAVAAQACDAAGGTNSLDGGATSPGRLVFRKSPGDIWVDSYTRVTSRFSDNRAVEVHLGVRVRGRSGVQHEADVLVLDEAEAIRCRAGGLPPRHQKTVAIIEAKYFANSPGLGVGRAFLGLGVELTHKRAHLAFPEPGTAEVRRLIAGQPCELHDKVWPGSRNEITLSELIRRAVLNWHARG